MNKSPDQSPGGIQEHLLKICVVVIYKVYKNKKSSNRAPQIAPEFQPKRKATVSAIKQRKLQNLQIRRQ